jgi:putative PIN family toxin of toxin-antitoxin system
LSNFVDFWKSGIITPLFAKQTYAEFRKVLEYPKFSLSAYEIDSLIQNEILPYFDVVATIGKRSKICRDPADDIFLAVAKTGKAEWLISGDNDLLVLAQHGQTRIITPAEFLERLSSTTEKL